MTIDSIIPQLQAKIKQHPTFKASVTFDMGTAGAVHIDTTQNPPLLVPEVREAVLTLTLSIDTMKGLLAGTQDPNVAYLTGKLKIKGPLGLAMKLNSMLED